MKKNELKNLRTKKETELRKMVSDKKLELVKTLSELKAGREKNPKKSKNIRHDIAQILTIVREKGLLEQSVQNREHRKREEEEK